MTRRSKVRALARYGAIAAVLPVAVAMGSPAEAAAGPAITSGSCSTSSYFFQCQIDWTGGTNPATVQWASVAGGAIGETQTNPQAHSSLAEGNCVPDGFYELKVTVTDAAGLSATTFLGGYCDA